MRERFRYWLESLDPAVREADHELGAWAGLGLAALILICVPARAPGVRELFQLPVGVALWSLLPVLVAGPAANFYDRWRGFTPHGYGFAVLGVGALLQFSASALAVCSSPPGAFLMAIFPILVASYHGFVFRATPRAPFVACAQAAGMVAALSLRPAAEPLALFAVVGPAALSGCLLLGSLADRNLRERARHDALRSAVQAQVLEERSSRVQRLSSALLEILERNHDASSALSTSLINADVLVQLCKGGTPNAADGDELLEIATGLRDAMRRLQRIVEETRRLGQESGGIAAESLALVDVADVVRAAALDVARRFPHVAIRSRVAGDASEPRAPVRGGDETMRRIVENLLVNACQGDGTHSACN